MGIGFDRLTPSCAAADTRLGPGAHFDDADPDDAHSLTVALEYIVDHSVGDDDRVVNADSGGDTSMADVLSMPVPAALPPS